MIEVRDKTQAGTAELVDVGYLSVQALSSDDYPDNLSRGVLADDAVYFINGTKVFSALWNDPFNQTGPH